MLSVEQLVHLRVGFDFGLGKVSAPVAVMDSLSPLDSSTDVGDRVEV